MRSLIIYCLTAPIVLAAVFIIVHVLLEVLKNFHTEFNAARQTGRTLPAALALAITLPLATFHHEGLARIKAAEARRTRALDATVDRHPAATTTLKAVPCPPTLTLINGGKR